MGGGFRGIGFDKEFQARKNLINMDDGKELPPKYESRLYPATNDTFAMNGASCTNQMNKNYLGTKEEQAWFPDSKYAYVRNKNGATTS